MVYHGLPGCTEDNPLAKTRGLSPHTDGQACLYHSLSDCTEDNPLLELVDYLLVQADFFLTKIPLNINKACILGF